MEHTVYVKYDSHTTGGEVCAEDKESSWPCHEPAYTEVTIHDLIYSENMKLGYDDIQVDFDPAEYIGKELHVVYVRYRTGNTFGSQHGVPSFPACFTTEEEAVKVERAISDNSWDGYKPWVGYFEGLESIEVLPLILKKG